MPENLLKRIEINPEVMRGKPVIKGTRIPVELILRKLSEGATEQDLRDAYPRLTTEDYLEIRKQSFEKETVASLYKQVEAFQKTGK